MIRDIARTMADRGQSAEEAKREEADYLVARPNARPGKTPGSTGPRRETAAERATRRANDERENRYYYLKQLFGEFADLTP